MRFDIRGDLKPVHRAMIALGAKQVPFASALALTTLAKGVQGIEHDLIGKTFDDATPFTRNAIAIRPATKSRLVATVFAKDIQAAYLTPYIVGGVRDYGNKKGMILPVDVPVNQFGNLTKGTLQRLKGKPGVFVGTVKTKAGIINGVWQRPVAGKVVGKRTKGARIVKPSGHLRLLLKFEDTSAVTKHFDFYGVAQRYLAKNAASVFDMAMRRALATAR